MSPTFPVIQSEHEQLARWIDHRLTMVERIMADLKTSLDSLTASVSDYTADVSAALAELQAKLDAAIVAGSADAAALAAMRADADAAVARIQSLDDAVKAADQPIDRPTP